MKDLDMVKWLLDNLDIEYCEQQTYYPQFDKYYTNIVLFRNNSYIMICFSVDGEACAISKNGNNVIIKEV